MTFRINRSPSSCIFSNLNRSVDSATRAIALNNQLSMEPRANPFENYRLQAAAAHAFAASKPFLTQSQPFSANSLLLSRQAHKSEITAEIKRHQKLYPLDYSVSSIQLFNELNGLSEIALLKKLDAMFHRDETDVATGLMLIQVQMQKGNVQMAAATLENLFHALKEVNEVKYAPGLVSLAVLLFPKVEKDDKATALLMDAKSYWSSKNSLVSHCDVIADSRECQCSSFGEPRYSGTYRAVIDSAAIPIAYSGIGCNDRGTKRVSQRTPLGCFYACDSCCTLFCTLAFGLYVCPLLLFASVCFFIHKVSRLTTTRISGYPHRCNASNSQTHKSNSASKTSGTRRESI